MLTSRCSQVGGHWRKMGLEGADLVVVNGIGKRREVLVRRDAQRSEHESKQGRKMRVAKKFFASVVLQDRTANLI